MGMPAIVLLPPGLPTVSPSRSAEWCPIAQHTWLRSTGNMASATKEVNFKFYLILINLYLNVNIHTCPWLPYRMVPKQRSAEGTNAHVHSSVAMVKLRSNHLKGGWRRRIHALGGFFQLWPAGVPLNHSSSTSKFCQQTIRSLRARGPKGPASSSAGFTVTGAGPELVSAAPGGP